MLNVTIALLWAHLGSMAAGTPPPAIPAGHSLRQAPMREAIPDSLPVAEWIGSPEVNVLLGYTRRPLHLPDGHRVALFTYSQSAPANWMFLVDARDMSFERHAIPNNDIASHSAALGSDGRIYLMPYATSRAYCFDPGTRRFEPLENDLPLDEYTWEALGASNGCIYFGTWPNAYFGEYCIASRAWTLWPQVAADTKYVTDFSETDDGRIRFKAWGPAEVWHEFDPGSRKLEVVSAPAQPDHAESDDEPKAREGDEVFRERIIVDGRTFALSFPTGRFWDTTAGQTPVLLGDTDAPAEPRWWLKASTDAVLGISYYGFLFHYDLNTGAFKRGQLDNRAPGGNTIMFLETVSPSCVIGANYSQQNLFALNPQTGELRYSRGMIARVPGEPYCAVGQGGRGYIGIYIHSLIMTYRPEMPFVYGENPLEIAQLYEPYAQTRPRAAATDGRVVVMTSDGDYNKLGGALAVVEPETNHVDIYPQIIQDQNLPTLAYDNTSGLFWGGTDRWGQMHSHPPTQKDPFVYAFDTAKREVVSKQVLWPGADVTAVLGVSANGVLVASSGEEIALMHTATGEVLYQGPSPIGSSPEAIPTKIRLGSDGYSYCAYDGILYRWNFETNRLTPLAKAQDCSLLTESEPGLWLLANRTSVFRYRVPGSP